MFDEQEDGQFGLAQWFDNVLFRIETWRPNLGATGPRLFACLALVALPIGWMVGRAVDRAPVEDRIPVAASASSIEALTDRTIVAEPTSADVRVGGQPDGSGSDAGPGPSAGADAADGAPEEAKPAVVHVAGAVEQPGLVTVPAGSRIHDAVVAAGGPTATADLHRLNLAAPVEDGMQIRVPMLEEETTGPLVLIPSPSAGDAVEAAGTGGPVDLNTASANQLDTLPGIGPATAAAILSWREENGGFHSVDDLLDVPGIGPAKLAAIEDLVAV